MKCDGARQELGSFTRFKILVTLSLTFQGHSRSNMSNVKVPLDSTYMAPLMFNSNCMHDIWPNVSVLQVRSLQNLSDLELTFQGHSRSNLMVHFDSPCI